MPRTRQLIALVLSLAYGLVAIAGHGLHALAPCGDEQCQSDRAVAAACDCGCHPPASAKGKPTDEPAFDRVAGHGHDSHSCAVCQALAKVKVGHAGLDAATVSQPVSQAQWHQGATLLTLDPPLLHRPRGPPSLKV